jgi:serine acetyltransferase
MCQKGPRALWYPLRWLQVVMFSSEIYRFGAEDGTEIGPGICFPHPANIIFAGNIKIGSGVIIYNNVSVGSDRHVPRDAVPELTMRIGDRTVVYGYTCLQGKYDIGHDAVVGMHVILDDHVPAGALRTYRGLRRAGTWRGEGRHLYRHAGAAPQMLRSRDH